MLYEKEALHYHAEPRLGKIEVVPIKPCLSQSDLSFAYTSWCCHPLPGDQTERKPLFRLHYESEFDSRHYKR